ncbi:MAG: amino acid permease [Bdellovibrionaceae bacterium]|nr:amino acid permease [Pseudobdellovibrionaceae bacterium]MBX3034555.1 amino acid permease [Pseudobdellovibrionaceae bacterium]
MTQESLLRRLGTKEAAAIVVGSVIGTGVFLKTATMAQQTGSPALVLLAWLVAGLLSLAGALSYAELGCLFPRAGGEYVYLKEAYGSGMGFLFGWTRFWIGSPGSIAAYAVGAATFLNGLIPLGDHRTLTALVIIAIFTGLNCFSVAFGGRLQTFMTALKLIMILGLTAAIFIGGSTSGWHHLSTPESGGWLGWSGFGAAVLAALWAFDGWNNLPMAAGEIRDPGRVIPRALGFGMLAVFLIYAFTNVAYFYALPFDEILTANSNLHQDALPVATKAVFSIFGAVGVTLLSAGFVFSAVGAMNGSILSSARVPFAMARDGLFFRRLGEVSHRSRVPVTALVVQGIWSSILALSGSFDQLTDYVVFASWIFYALGAAAVLVLRRRRPDQERSFRTPFYPWLPLIFLVCSVLLLANTLWTSPLQSLIGLGFILMGIPAYLFFRGTSKGMTNS